MTYQEIIKYIFLQENQDFEAIPVTNKCRTHDLVLTRQMCMTLGRYCLHLTNTELARAFNQDHATVNNAMKQVRNLQNTDRVFYEKYGRYLTHIQCKIMMEAAIMDLQRTRPGSVASRTFNSTVVQIEVTETGYLMKSSKLENDLQTDRSVPMSAEGMRAVVDCFCEIHSLILSKKL